MNLHSKRLFILTLNITSLLIPILLVVYSLRVLLVLNAETGLDSVAIQKFTFLRNIAFVYYSILFFSFGIIIKLKKKVESFMELPFTLSIVGAIGTLLAFIFAALLYDYVVPLF